MAALSWFAEGSGGLVGVGACGFGLRVFFLVISCLLRVPGGYGRFLQRSSLPAKLHVLVLCSSVFLSLPF